jgi:uncharacterized protein GlcG (DUF336 family)
VDAALSKARELELRPLTITVLDSGGHPIVVKREDGAGILRPQIAQGNLLGAIGVSGDRPENDEKCAVAGVASVNLVADAG